MTPPLNDEQSQEERLAIARRYREQRGLELRQLAASGIAGAEPDSIEAAGEFSTVPTESIASIPGLGIFLIPIAKRRAAKLGLTPQVLVALTAEQVHVLKLRPAGIRRPLAEIEPGRSWPRAEVQVEAAGRAFMREKFELRHGEEPPLLLFAPSLKTNPWSAAVIRLLGGEAPEPLDLGDPA